MIDACRHCGDRAGWHPRAGWRRSPYEASRPPGWEFFRPMPSYPPSVLARDHAFEAAA